MLFHFAFKRMFEMIRMWKKCSRPEHHESHAKLRGDIFDPVERGLRVVAHS